MFYMLGLRRFGGGRHSRDRDFPRAVCICESV